MMEPGRRCHGNLMELLVTQFVSHATKVLELKASLKDNRIQNEEFLIYSYVYYANENFATNVELTFYMRP
jgi:hypothetical protein